LEEQHALPFLRELLLFLSFAGILIPVLQRLRVNQVLGFLAAGALFGPFGLGLWADASPWLHYITFRHVEDIVPLADLGVQFLMFMIGLELSTERLWALRRWVFGAGVAQVGVTALCIGGIAWVFGHRLDSAAVLGLVLSLSSTAVVMQLLNERRALGSPLGQAAFSILMLQDLAVVPIFILMGVLSKGTGAGMLPMVALTLVKSVGAIALIYLLGRRVIRPVFSTLAKVHQPEVFMALTLLSSLGIAGLTAAAGLSTALGAFLAGLLLSETEFRHEVEVTIEPFKGLLMGLFFMSVGMQIDVRQVLDNPLWIPVSVCGLFLIKGAVLAAILRSGGHDWGRAIEGGLLLGQGGEFAFIVVGAAIASRLLEPADGQFIMLVVSLSLFVTPFAAKAGRLIGNRWPRGNGAARQPDELPDTDESRVVIAGFGRVGQLLAQMLAAQNIPYVAFESDARLVARMREEGFDVYFGNASRMELLNKADFSKACAIVLTMDHPASAVHALKAIRARYPSLPVLARSRDERHARTLRKFGATTVIPETLESGLQLAGSVLQTVGVEEGRVAEIVRLERIWRSQAIDGENEERRR
jgi:CPA2 family monovalent cation:H+ antiporter-2